MQLTKTSTPTFFVMWDLKKWIPGEFLCSTYSQDYTLLPSTQVTSNTTPHRYIIHKWSPFHCFIDPKSFLSVIKRVTTFVVETLIFIPLIATEFNQMNEMTYMYVCMYVCMYVLILFFWTKKILKIKFVWEILKTKEAQTKILSSQTSVPRHN